MRLAKIVGFVVAVISTEVALSHEGCLSVSSDGTTVVNLDLFYQTHVLPEVFMAINRGESILPAGWAESPQMLLAAQSRAPREMSRLMALYPDQFKDFVDALASKNLSVRMSSDTNFVAGIGPVGGGKSVLYFGRDGTKWLNSAASDVNTSIVSSLLGPNGVAFARVVSVLIHEQRHYRWYVDGMPLTNFVRDEDATRYQRFRVDESVAWLESAAMTASHIRAAIAAGNPQVAAEIYQKIFVGEFGTSHALSGEIFQAITGRDLPSTWNESNPFAGYPPLFRDVISNAVSALTGGLDPFSNGLLYFINSTGQTRSGELFQNKEMYRIGMAETNGIMMTHGELEALCRCGSLPRDPTHPLTRQWALQYTEGAIDIAFNLAKGTQLSLWSTGPGTVSQVRVKEEVNAALVKAGLPRMSEVGLPVRLAGGAVGYFDPIDMTVAAVVNGPEVKVDSETYDSLSEDLSSMAPDDVIDFGTDNATELAQDGYYSAATLGYETYIYNSGSGGAGTRVPVYFGNPFYQFDPGYESYFGGSTYIEINGSYYEAGFTNYEDYLEDSFDVGFLPDFGDVGVDYAWDY